MPPTDNQSVNTVWATQTEARLPTFLTLPSGQTCYATAIGLGGVIEAGLLGEADSLTAFVGSEYLRKVRGVKGRPDGEEMDTAKLLKDPEVLRKIMRLVDQVCPMVVKDPELRYHLEMVDGTERVIPAEDRVPGLIYTDVVGVEDKMFLFNFAVSGMRDAQKFRQESQALVATVEDVASVPDDTQSAAQPRAKRRRPPRRR